MTNDEWDYLINKRPNACAYYTVAQVNGTNGLILLPDNWTAPKDIVIASGMNTYVPGENYNYDYAAYQTFTAAEWKKLEKNGAVFLPASGYRWQDGVYGTETKVSQLQEFGRYWSSTPATAYYELGTAYHLAFDSGYLYISISYMVEGYNVRLVKDL